MTWTGVAIGGGVAAGAALSYIGGQKSANAAGDAATAQAYQAQRNRADAMALSQATPQELSTLSRSYDTAMQRLNQQQQLMSSIDPSLMEASKQILQIMRGGQGGPSSDMYNSQRQQLISKLRDQFGPGGELTSIGRQALNQFDMQAKSGELGQLSGVLGMGGTMEGGLNSALNEFQQVGQGYSNIQQRQINASLNTGSQLLQTAGADSVGAALSGQGLASLGNNVMQGASTLGGAYLFGSRGGSGAGYARGGYGGDSGSTYSDAASGAYTNYGPTGRPGGFSQPSLGSSYMPQGDPAWYFGH